VPASCFGADSQPDREPATAEARLSGRPQVEVVARDRGGGYALPAARGLPQAVQVADCEIARKA
jgi:hypothetical protein